MDRARATFGVKQQARAALLRAFRMLPDWARDLVWRRTPAQRLREARVLRGEEAVIADLRARLEAGPGRAVFFLPSQTWYSTHFQRPQQLARALAASGSPVVYCERETYLHVTDPRARDELSFWGVKDVGERLHLLRWPERALRRLVDRAQPDALLMIWPWQASMFSESGPSRVIYEVIDDHDLIPDAGEEFKRLHREWVAKADVLVATADDLVAQLKPLRDSVLLLPNAVTMEDWQAPASQRVPEDMAEARRAERVAIYYGTFASWFDWDLLIGVAQRLPNWSFVLIGPPYDGNVAAVRAQVARAPNVFYLGSKSYSELPQYIQHADVATIPFVLNSITHACSPVKLFEYMAAGKPIVTTAMREVLKYKSVLIGESADDFAAKLQEAVAKGSDAAYQAILREEAVANTWRSRAEALTAALAAACAGGKPPRRLQGSRP